MEMSSAATWMFCGEDGGLLLVLLLLLLDCSVGSDAKFSSENGNGGFGGVELELLLELLA